MKELKVGYIPFFIAKDATGSEFDSKTLVGQKLVIFIQKIIPGCTAEACSFRDLYEDFKDLGV
jgi:peroxiredoxin Q/BCP